MGIILIFYLAKGKNIRAGPLKCVKNMRKIFMLQAPIDSECSEYYFIKFDRSPGCKMFRL